MVTLSAYSSQSPDCQAFFRQLNGLCNTHSAQEAPPFMHETVFQQLLLDMLDAERPAEHRRFKRILLEAMVHFRRMKEGDLTNGFAQLQRLRATFPPVSPEVRRLGEAMLSPMIAYYYFRVGDFPTASYYNQQAVAISSDLQSTYAVLHLHQIQQQFNLSRIELAQHRYTDALHILKELIDYLVMGRPPKLTGSWPAGFRHRLDASLLRNQLLDILNELVFTALKRSELENSIPDWVLSDAGQSLSQRFVPTPSPESALRIWWQSYQTEPGDQQHLFWFSLVSLIEQYPREYDPLKLLLLGRLHFLVAHSGSAGPDYLQLIRRFVNTKLWLSPRIRQFIRLVRSQPTAN